MNIIPIRRKPALEALDNDQLLAGYFAGFRGETCPFTAPYSFQHGWKNGAVDAGFRKIDSSQLELARDVVRGGL